MSRPFIESISRLTRRVPGKAWLAVGGLLVGAFWLQQHDARIRQQARLEQLRNQTSAQMAALRRQAAEDVRQANVENAKAIAKLEQRRQQTEQQNRDLAAQLARLRRQAQIQAGEVATLPVSEIVTRVAAQLGLKAEDVAPLVMSADAGSKLQITNDELQEPGGVSVHAGVRNQDLCDLCGPKALTQRAQRASVSSVLKLFNPQSARRRPEETITNDELQENAGEAARAADMAKRATSAPAETTPHPAAGASTLFPRRGRGDAKENPVVLPLTASGARKVEGALVALKACRAESKIETRQISNCQARAEADDAEVKRLQSSVSSLNRALDAKDKILAQQQNECQAELRAARGTFLGRLAHAAEHVAIGVALGVAIGVAVK